MEQANNANNIPIMQTMYEHTHIYILYTTIAF